MKITFVISRLLAGGVERVLINLTTAFLKHGYEVSVLTLFNENLNLYNLPSEIKQESIGVDSKPKNIVGKIFLNFKRIYALRKKILANNPDVVISFVNTINVIVLLALTGINMPIIVAEHNDPRLNPTKIWRVLRRLIYSKATALISVNKNIDKYFHWIPQEKRFIIPNPLTPLISKPGKTIFGDSPKKHIIAMGEFDKVKGFDLLIRAFSKITNKYQGWDLWILGDGPERKNLEELVLALNLKDVFLPGRISNPFPTLKTASLFVLSSRSESFGNVLIEAMACGLPIITTACDGPKEIIDNGVNGIIIPTEDINALATTMDQLISDSLKRKHLSIESVKAVKKFDLESIFSSWEKVVEQILNKDFLL